MWRAAALVQLVGVTLGLFLLAVATVAQAGQAGDPPAVILDLGPVVATPAPTPEAATRRRLITTITVQNAAGAQSIISFEATDLADKGLGKYRTIAAARYSLSDDSPKLKPMRTKILKEIRDLERDLLDYVKVAGPPKERRPLLAGPHGDEDEKPKGGE